MPVPSSSAQALLAFLRADPAEWRRRGLSSPVEIATMVAERCIPDDPSYADFFVDTARDVTTI